MDAAAASTAVRLNGIAIADQVPAWTGQTHVAANGAKVSIVKVEPVGAAADVHLRRCARWTHDVHVVQSATDGHPDCSVRRGQHDLDLAGSAVYGQLVKLQAACIEDAAGGATAHGNAPRNCWVHANAAAVFAPLMQAHALVAEGHGALLDADRRLGSFKGSVIQLAGLVAGMYPQLGGTVREF